MAASRPGHDPVVVDLRDSECVTLDLLRPHDLPELAELHRTELPDGFFARLGPGFLRAYLETFGASPHAVAFAVRRGDRTIGMVVGTTRNRDHYGWVIRARGARLAIRGVLALIIRPPLLLFFLRTRARRYLRGIMVRLLTIGGRATAPEDPNVPDANVAVLAHLVIARDGRGRGLGARLVEAFVEECQGAGCTQIRLITAAETGAAGFYDRLGWREVTRRPAADGTSVVEFGMALPDHLESEGGA